MQRAVRKLYGRNSSILVWPCDQDVMRRSTIGFLAGVITQHFGWVK